MGHGLFDHGLQIVLRRCSEAQYAERLRQLHEVRIARIRVGVVVLVVNKVLPLGDHSKLVVVHDGVLHRDVVFLDGGQFCHRHLKSAIAGNRPDGAAGGADLNSHGGRHLEAHRAESAGRVEAVRHVERAELGRPHLVLAYAGHYVRSAVGGVSNRLHYVLAEQLVCLANLERRVLRLEMLDVAYPLCVL